MRCTCLSLIIFLLSTSAARGSDFDDLCQWLTGTFSSRQQSEQDSQYFDIRLGMTRVWADRTDGYWLYVEQARADAMNAPYRQRIYQVVDLGDGVFESRVYTLPGETPQETIRRFAGAAADPSRLDNIGPGDLKLREGCSIYLKRQPDGSFSGGTRGNGCPSTRDGAAYTTSEVKLSAELMESWDRGWDKDGKQVWGATVGGYRFVREK